VYTLVSEFVVEKVHHRRAENLLGYWARLCQFLVKYSLKFIVEHSLCQFYVGLVSIGLYSYTVIQSYTVDTAYRKSLVSSLLYISTLYLYSISLLYISLLTQYRMYSTLSQYILYCIHLYAT
jgi:hypothetical protein